MGRAARLGCILSLTILTVSCTASRPLKAPAPGGAVRQRESLTLTRSISSRSTARESAPTPRVIIEPRPSVQYLDRFAECIDRGRAQMPQITASAEVAAARVCRGGRLFVFSTQKDFLNETLDRPGGLAMLAQVPKVINRGDVILYAVPSKLAVGDRVRIADWRDKGAYVIAFASAALSADRYFHPDVLIDSGDEEGLIVGNPAEERICPTDTVANIANCWAWTGEFVAACTRLGRMPVMNGDPGASGGLARASFYRGKPFHEGEPRTSALPPGQVGGDYLDRIAAAVAGVRESSAHLAWAGQWLRDARPDARGLYAASTLFPHHFEDPRAPQPFTRRDDLKLRQPPPTPLSLVIGYQDPPQIAIDSATLRRGRVIYTSARRDGADGRQEVVYINPHYPTSDACVVIPGYDIKVLPTASVMQAAVYWSLVAETAGVAPNAAR